MESFLKAIDITDFRSITGSVNIRLDAPVVLLHGGNGIGKTSVMSAIELALTGRVSAFSQIEREYEAYLTHKGRAAARVQLTTAKNAAVSMSVEDGRIVGNPLLSRELRNFFSERCYLDQFTLSRLLEIYQREGSEQQAALTRFVKDLLGVDQLDALIDGLHAAGDVRRIRQLVPEYRATENELETLRLSLAQRRIEIATLVGERRELERTILDALESLRGPTDADILKDPATLEKVLDFGGERRETISFGAMSKEIDALRDVWSNVKSNAAGEELAAAEEEARRTEAALDEWSRADGSVLRQLIDYLRESITDIPDMDVTDPDFALRAAQAQVRSLVSSLQKRISNLEASITRAREIDRGLNLARARVETIKQRLASFSVDSDQLASALSSLMPHLHSNECPVCGRDYSEVSSDPLINRVSSEITRLTRHADQLRSLSIEYNKAQQTVTNLQSERQVLVRTGLPTGTLAESKKRLVDIEEASQEADRLFQTALLGTELRGKHAAASRRVMLVRKGNREAIQLRRSVDNMLSSLGIVLPGSASLEDRVAALSAWKADRAKSLEERSRLRIVVDQKLRQLRALLGDLDRQSEAIATQDQRVAQLSSALLDVADRRELARSVSMSANLARNAVVHRVFTDSLNKLWRQLFVRLAPEEGFIPAFKVPTSVSGNLKIELETKYRQGGTGGTPGTMLSTGNLNTAALTLFLALHLSVKPKLPLLMLDDPVQSMDEIHTVQFAALLRMLSKEDPTRQILIAVHERSLFDYLAFELAPSFVGDRLITVELSRSSETQTIAECQYKAYKSETAVA